MKQDNKHQCQVFHFDLYGERESKYQFLQENTLQTIQWQQLNPQAPQFFFVPKDFSLQEEYDKGFKVDELMRVNKTGIETGRDELFVSDSEQESSRKIIEVINDNRVLQSKYNVKEDSSFRITNHIGQTKFDNSKIVKYVYRPFDCKSIYYDKDLLRRPFYEVMRNLIDLQNVALVVPRQCTDDWKYAFCINCIADRNLIASAQKLGAGNVFPLYLYPEDGSLETERRANLDEKIWQQINAAIGREATPEQVFDYIYGVLHSPRYRAKYKEFLKVDFPRIPYPASAQEFERYRNAGNRLRQLHLMHNLPAPQVTFPESGTLAVEKAEYRQGRVYINETQYFDGVPAEAWNFYIGGYQPAQKWLKDRRGRTLSFEDVRHYQQIIYVLQETERIMGEIG